MNFHQTTRRFGPLATATAIALAIAIAIGITFAKDHEKEIPLRDVPAKAFKALVLLKGDTEFEKIESEKENGVHIYEAEWESDGREHSATVDAAGTLLEREHTVGMEEVPQAVAKTIAKHFPKGGEREIELQMSVTYEVTVELDGKEIELTLTPDGKVLKKNVEED